VPQSPSAIRTYRILFRDARSVLGLGPCGCVNTRLGRSNENRYTSVSKPESEIDGHVRMVREIELTDLGS